MLCYEPLNLKTAQGEKNGKAPIRSYTKWNGPIYLKLLETNFFEVGHT